MRSNSLFLLLTLATFSSTYADTTSRPPLLPVLITEPVKINDASRLTALAAEINTAMRVRHSAPLFLRIYVQPTLVGNPREGFLLSPAPAYANLLAHLAALATDAELAPLRAELGAIVTPGEASYLKAVRFDGTHAPGWLCNRLVRTDDEAHLLSLVDALHQLLQRPGEIPPFINVFRFIAGPGQATHLVSINAPSSSKLAAHLTAQLTPPRLLVDPRITVLSTAIYQELETSL